MSEMTNLSAQGKAALDVLAALDQLDAIMKLTMRTNPESDLYLSLLEASAEQLAKVGELLSLAKATRRADGAAKGGAS